MRGPSSNETFASRGGRGIENCGQQKETLGVSQIIIKMQVLQCDGRLQINNNKLK